MRWIAVSSDCRNLQRFSTYPNVVVRASGGVKFLKQGDSVPEAERFYSAKTPNASIRLAA